MPTTSNLDRLPIAFLLVAFGFLLLITLNSVLVGAGLVLIVGGILLLSSWVFPRRRVDQGTRGGPAAPSGGAPESSVPYSLLALWRSDPGGMAIDLLRVGVGLVWVVNMLFILDPGNQFFATFQDVAVSYAGTTVGGPGIADFVAGHAAVFAWLTAVLSAYLAVAFVLGFTTRLACLLGALASVAFFVTQFLTTFQIPGGTDVGAHPLYLLIYLVLFAGGAGRYLAVDNRVWATGRARFPRLARWIATPRP
jgi:uncharacterized membrane protein YphA (DoxX/SURF4 family)